jgi:transcriptional regulator with XRE-family HTH domain
MLGDNLRAAFSSAGLVVKEVAAKANVSKGSIDNWVSKGKEPKVVSLYAVCKTVGITMEQALDGEAGAEYVRQWARNQGGIWEPPSRIADIVNGLVLLDDGELVPVRAVVNAMADAKKGRESSAEAG